MQNNLSFSQSPPTQLVFFSHVGLCVVLTLPRVNKETPLQTRGAPEVPFGQV